MTREAGADDLRAKVAVLRALALHGPMPRYLLLWWHLDGVDGESQRAAIRELLSSGHVVEMADGRLDVRGADRSRWALMSDAERHARAEAVESAVRVAHHTFELHRAVSELRIAEAAKAGADMAAEAAHGLAAARRADALKGER